jgi:predicted RNase H-like HicB family nuclease
MRMADKYVKLVEWSDEDGCFIGSCPELFYGGCHGDDPRGVFDELCQIVEEMIEIYECDGKPMPTPMTGHEFVAAMQRVAKRVGALDAVPIAVSANKKEQYNDQKRILK